MGLRLAVVGLAGMGAGHLRLASSLDDYELVAVCDIAPGPLAQATQATGVRGFTDMRDLLESNLAEAVVIATPPFLHLAQVCAALEAGLHVYCEKPMCVTVDEADEIARHAEAAGRKVQVGFQHRFQHSFAAAHRLVDEQQVGDVHRANLFSTNWFRPQAYFDARPWRGRWREAGGGVLMNQAIHHIDALLWLVGMPAKVVAKAWRARHRVEVEDDVTVLFELPGGANGVIVASTTDPIGTDRLEVHGELGSVLSQGQSLRHGALAEPAQHLCDTCPDAFPRVRITWQDVPVDGGPASFNEFVLACHRDFLDAIAGDRDPLNHPREAAKSVELANAAYLSAVRDEPVSLPLDRAAYAQVHEALISGAATLPIREGLG